MKAVITELTACITNFKRAGYLDRCIASCAGAGILNVVVASMCPDAEVRAVISKWQAEPSIKMVWTSMDVDMGCNELWLQAAYRAKTKHVLVIHDDDFLDADFKKAWFDHIRPALFSGSMVTWRASNKWDSGDVVPTNYIGGESRKMSVSDFQGVILDYKRLSLSPLVSVFNRSALIQALKECDQYLTSPGSFWHPEMLLGTEIVAHFRNSQKFKSWLYLDRVLGYYGTHEGSGTVLAWKRGESEYLVNGYNLARKYCSDTVKPKPVSGRIIFTYSDYESKDPEDARRNSYARTTWEPWFVSGDMLDFPVTDSDLTRSSAEFGDERPVPFVKDIINRAMQFAMPEDILVYANRDICLTRTSIPKIRSTVAASGGVGLATRRNIRRPIPAGKIYKSVLNCYADDGFDLFAFTPAWWNKNQKDMPDMLIGREVWDAVFRRLAQERNGDAVFMDDVIYHEFHDSFWIKERKKNAGQLYNRRLGREFFCNRSKELGDGWFQSSARHIMELLKDE